MAELPRDRIYAGAAGRVVALDVFTGREAWRTKLRGRGFVTLGLTADRVIAATGGHIFALDPVTGALLWENDLKGMGFGLISVPGLGGEAVLHAAAVEAEHRRRAAAGA